MMLRDRWGYIYGTAGIKWTQARQDAATNDMARKYGSRWVGHMVADCSGVMVYIWKQHGLSIYHGSNTIRKKYCGELTKTPAPGYAAFKLRDGDDYYHIGIVAEDGLNVYESRGTQTGFVTSAASSWNCFAPFNDVDYTGGEQMEPFKQYLAIVDTQKGSLNVREKPDTDSKILFRVGRGETVWVMEETGTGWARIDDDGMQGYASMAYLKKAADLPSELPEEPDEGTPAPPAEPPKNAILRGVWIPCDNEEEARRYAGDIKNAVILRKECV
jgi:hypothetical protein